MTVIIIRNIANARLPFIFGYIKHTTFQALYCCLGTLPLQSPQQFSLLTNLYYIYLIFFWSITMFTFHLILNDHIWCSFLFWTDLIYVLVTKYVQIKYFKTKEPILLTFWLQNRYKSATFRTDWDPNPKVHRVIPVLWRFTNPNPNPIESEPIQNRIFI